MLQHEPEDKKKVYKRKREDVSRIKDCRISCEASLVKHLVKQAEEETILIMAVQFIRYIFLILSSLSPFFSIESNYRDEMTTA